MQHFTTCLPKEQLPLSRDFVQSPNIEIKKFQDPLPNTTYQINMSNSANSYFTQNLSWEYFSNELEFE
jgi:hypothetical protein